MRNLTRRSILALAAAVPLGASASARTPSPDDIEQADWRALSARAPAGPSPALVKLQVFLDRKHASPGVIDGHDGANVRKAIRAARELAGLDAGDQADEALWTWLDDGRPVLERYRVTEDDLKGPFEPHLPTDFAELARMRTIPFRNVGEMLAERFHMDEDLLQALNPRLAEASAGTELVVAAPGERRQREGRLSRIEVRVREGLVRALTEDEALVVAYPASVGSPRTPSPEGTHRVTGVARNPVYHYDPERNFQQGRNTRRLRLPPGPNNPVGTVWIDLSKPTYGIHGTPEPSRIDKAGSHGCVRLTNWDAEELAGLVHVGLTVDFVA